MPRDILLQLLQIADRGLRRRVAAIEEGMHRDLHPGIGDDAGQRRDLVLMRMHPAGRDQPHHMRGAAAFLELADELLQGRQVRDLAFGERLVDARQILQHDPARPDIGVADLGIAHLAVGQPDIVLARIELGVRPAAHQLVPDRGFGPADRIIGAVRPLAPAVEDAQHDRFRAGSHGSRCLG